MKYSSKSEKEPKIALIGPLPPPIGGTTVSFNLLLNRWTNQKKSFELLPTPVAVKGGIRKNIILARFLLSLFCVSGRVDLISLHIPTLQVSTLGFVTLMVCRLRNIKLIVRKFGGTDINTLGITKRFITKFVIKNCDAFFAQSKQQCAELMKFSGRQIYWYPSNRPVSANKKSAKYIFSNHFVYVSHIRPEKGIYELIQAVDFLGGVCEVDVYGPFYGGLNESVFSECKYVRYCGVLNNEEVVPTIQKYAALILPTYWPGEGYPGIIIEAFQAGLPVITTKWKAIPEIVDKSCGILIPPRNIDELTAALRKAAQEPGIMQTMHQGAMFKAQEFSTERWSDLLFDFCCTYVNYADTEHGYQRINQAFPEIFIEKDV